MKFRILIVLVSITFSIKAQHAYFSSLNQNLLSVNPAFAGTNDKLRTQIITGSTGDSKFGYRPQSYYAGADFLCGKRSGLGLSFNSNIYSNSLNNTQVGYRELQVDFSYGLHLKVNDKLKLIPAIQISYFQNTLNRRYVHAEYLRTGRIEQWGTETVYILNKRNLDFSAALLLYGKRFYAGASILSFTQPDEGLLGVSKRPITQIYHGKYKLLDPEKFNIDCYGLIKLQENFWYNKAGFNTKNTGENFIQYGTYLNYKVLSIHLAHQLNEISNYDAFISGVSLNVKGFRVGYNNKCNYGNRVSTYFFNEFYLLYAFGRNKKDDEETPDNTIRLID